MAHALDRFEFGERVAVRTEEKLIELRAEAIAVGKDRLVQMIDAFLLSFEKALEEGGVRSDNPTDVNTLATRKAFIFGGADSRSEVRTILSLESIQERYARMLRDQRGDAAALRGEASSRRREAAEQQALPEDAVGVARGARARGAEMSRFRRIRRGRVYTTEEVGGPKAAQLMIFAGWIEPLGKGLYWAAPDRSVGKTRPSDLRILSVLLRGKAFLVTGNERWDALGLGVTKPLGKLLVYTLRRKGENLIGGRRFWFVRVYKGARRFPTGPVREWWIIELLEDLELVGLDRDAVLASLSAALVEGRFNREVLVDQATTWATPSVLRMVSAALAGASLPRTGLVPGIGRSASRSAGPRARPKRQQETENERVDAPTTR